MSINEQHLISSISNDIMHLIILPTEACNFRCVYCYEDFEQGKMKPEMVRALKKFITSRMFGLSSLTISWFGGEPLLALDIIEEVSEYVNTLLKKYPKVSYYADMTTNAYLLETRLFHRLTELGIRHYQISFDGPRELHDKKRILAVADDKGTFDRIWSNLLEIKKESGQFTIYVRLHLDKENYPRIFEFVKAYEALFKEDKRFKLFFRPLSCLGGKNDKNLPVFNEIDAKMKVNELKQYMRDNNINHKIFNSSHSLCYATKLNSFVVRSSGIINKCTVALKDEINQVGELNKNGTLTIDSKKFLWWGRGLESGKHAELSCPLQSSA